ncbi:hypothetical protein HY04_11900 [Kaistella antarctica]|uniref:Uncharacterized protein n=1 Tax=Kaistella antarctica TaxID=266748 RepID=A0ABR4TYU1_9FLAO|nr:hypothetical protein HY04_11900 [Kaistella antarctica]
MDAKNLKLYSAKITGAKPFHSAMALILFLFHLMKVKIHHSRFLALFPFSLALFPWHLNKLIRF